MFKVEFYEKWKRFKTRATIVSNFKASFKLDATKLGDNFKLFVKFVSGL